MFTKLWLLLHQQPTIENKLALWPENFFEKEMLPTGEVCGSSTQSYENRKKISLHKNNNTTIDTVEHLNRGTTS